jgi:hypothetical protein
MMTYLERRVGLEGSFLAFLLSFWLVAMGIEAGNLRRGKMLLQNHT